MKTLVIDGNNLIHRTYWTAKTQSKRTDTDTLDQLSNFHIYFTLNAVYSYVAKFTPTRTIFIWDEKPDYQKNDRKLQFEDYKGNRSGDPSPHQNNETIKQLLSYLGIASIFPRELEADDIAAYICKQTEGQKVIVSVDKDFLQLIQPEVILYDPIRKTEYRYDTFEDQTGWSVDNWLVAKCCMGDKSDNVPGLVKFGNSKIKKFISGEIVLTDEQQEIYSRNYSLFSLDAIMQKAEEQEYYKQQLSVPVNTNWSAFVEECNKRQFNAILKKKEAWHTLFFLTAKLSSIFG